MDEALEMNKKLMEEAIRCLEKGYNAEDFHVLSQALDNIKDIETIQAMSEPSSIAKKLCTHFEEYKETKSNAELDKTMKVMMQMISMIQKLVVNEEDKNIVKEHLRNMLNMYM